MALIVLWCLSLKAGLTPLSPPPFPLFALCFLIITSHLPSIVPLRRSFLCHALIVSVTTCLCSHSLLTRDSRCSFVYKYELFIYSVLLSIFSALLSTLTNKPTSQPHHSASPLSIHTLLPFFTTIFSSYYLLNNICTWTRDLLHLPNCASIHIHSLLHSLNFHLP